MVDKKEKSKMHMRTNKGDGFKMSHKFTNMEMARQMDNRWRKDCRNEDRNMARRPRIKI